MKNSYYESGELMTTEELDQNGARHGQFSEFYTTGELKKIENYIHGTLVDTTIQYYQNGTVLSKSFDSQNGTILEKHFETGELESRGIQLNGHKSGWWSYFDKKGRITYEVEYINGINDSLIKNREHPNQVIKFDSKQDTLFKESNYYRIDITDTLPTKKVTFGSIKVIPQTSKEADFHKIYYWIVDPEGQVIQSDSTYGTNSKKAEIYVVPKMKGPHQLKGFVLEEGYRFEEIEDDTTMVNYIRMTKKMILQKAFYADIIN